ncbi:endo-1,4-beta-xylanase [Actinotalea fermentans]|uniref:Beta-xylanase n=1 Tax=Actinotalea fermentans TaxID=43671 RepID=A0A511YTW3_9CELL|nr:endo-1,4-beta-xylanase [Actinotalea fermentans]GEN78638.1 beta-xylanase [Actinotalea fermentans]
MRRSDGRRRRVGALVAVVALALVACSDAGGDDGGGGETGGATASARPALDEPHRALRDVAPDGVVVGTAAAGGGHLGTGRDPFQVDERYRALVGSEFSSVTPENQLKWEYVHPERDGYTFEAADDVVDFAQEHGMVVRGHTLLWHSQNPAWLEQGDYSPAELREILHEHVTTVVGRYAGRVAQWDVANEIIDERGRLRTQENIWLRELGPGVIADAFRWAHEADPDALLFLNDYDAEVVNAKSDAYLALATDLLAQGVPVHGFGVQGHLVLERDPPGEGLAANLQRFADLGLATAVTEADVRMVLEDGRATPEQLALQGEYYANLVAGCLAVAGCDSITLWGFTDRYSWVPSWFEGLGAATVLTEDYVPKPAYDAVAAALEESR